MSTVPSDPEARERILKASMIRKGLPYISAPPTSPRICPDCDAGDPTNVITSCDCAAQSAQSTHPYFPGCKCYVRYLAKDTAFALHYGAHNLTCPVYRVGLDPVDRRADDDFRARVEIEAPDVH